MIYDKKALQMIWTTKSATNNEPIRVSAVINDMHTQNTDPRPPEYSWTKCQWFAKNSQILKTSILHQPCTPAHPDRTWTTYENILLTTIEHKMCHSTPSPYQAPCGQWLFYAHIICQHALYEAANECLHVYWPTDTDGPPHAPSTHHGAPKRGHVLPRASAGHFFLLGEDSANTFIANRRWYT